MESLKYLFRIGHGPSSSHTIGPQKACEFILNKYHNADYFVVTLFASLALTGKGHLTDYIIKKIFNEKRVNIIFDYKTKVDHPNTMTIEVYENNTFINKHFFVSVGGGALIIDDINNELCQEIYPFNSFNEIKSYCINNNLTLPEFVYKFEGEEIKDYLKKIYEVMLNSYYKGINNDGLLPGELKVIRKAKYFLEKKNENENDDTKKIRLVSSIAYAISEENASGGEIVTAPTCGACAVLPACLIYLQQKNNINTDKIIDALAVSSIIGNIVKKNACISGAYAGCQSEIGTACSMAAAAVSYLNNSTIDEIEYASEIAMEHHLGLTCDPVKGLVQIPCIERNAVASLRALDSATLALFLTSSRKVSFDTVVETMYETGKDLSQAYKETSLAGLAKHYKK